MRRVSLSLFLLAVGGLESVEGFVGPAGARITASSAASTSLRVGVAPPPPASASTASENEDPPVATVADVEEAPVAATSQEEDEEVVDTNRLILPGRYTETDKSIALPFLSRPRLLDGTHAGDYGFDPLGLTEDYDLYTMQEAELRHARLAMLAVVGWPLSELVGAPDWMLAENGRAPSVLNGFTPVSFLATLIVFAGFGVFEYTTALRKVDTTPTGIIHRKDMENVWEYGVAGDYGFDPLNWYSTLLGDDPIARKGLREVEISHGRSAMLGITAFAAWEFLTGAPIVENSMFFHPNLLLPALVAGYVAFNTFYEVEESDMYYRFKLSSEGEARLSNMQLGGKSDGGDGGREFELLNKVSEKLQLSEKAEAVSEKLGAKAGELYEKLQAAYKENVSSRD